MLLDALRKDSELDAAAATSGLFITACDLQLRFEQRARTYETESGQISFLASHEVQDMLVTFLIGVAAST